MDVAVHRPVVPARDGLQRRARIIDVLGPLAAVRFTPLAVLQQTLPAVLGQRAPMFDLFEGTGKLGAEIVPLGFDLEEQRPALVAFCQQHGLPVIGARCALDLEGFQSRHVSALSDKVFRQTSRGKHIRSSGPWACRLTQSSHGCWHSVPVVAIVVSLGVAADWALTHLVPT